MTQNVLVVEDDAILRMLATEAIEILGVSVIACECAEQALSVLETCPESVTLVFTDVNMPGAMDGLALTAEILARWQGISVIVTSGKMGVLPNAQGQYLFLPKPWTLESLHLAILARLSKY